VFLLLCASLPTAAAAQTTEATDPAAATDAFRRLQSLAGTWDFRTPADSGQVTYEVVSDGSALLERVVTGHHREAGMVSVIHLDAGRLVLQHYCSAANQPRLVATRIAPNEIVFELERLGNASLTDGHISRAVFVFPGHGAFQSRWTWREHGSTTTSTREHAQ
jgi:hypothetical protein